MGERVPTAEWFREVLEGATDVVCAFTPTGEITYLNRAAERVFGVVRAEVLGENVASWVHPDDLERAFEVMSLLAIGEFDRTPVTPALYRIRRADGSWLPLEVNGSIVSGDGEDDGSIVIICRYPGDRVLHDDLLDRLTRGDPLEEIIALVPDLGLWRHPTEKYSVAFTTGEGQRIALGSRLPRQLDGSVIGDPSSPWSQALRSGGEVGVGLDELPADVREIAVRHGLQGCRVAPVADPTVDESATITIWSTHNGPPISIHRYGLDTMKRALGLILQWRYEMRQLTRASLTDHLTGAASRSRFFALLDQAAPDDEGDLAAILYVDLDRFKPVNDEYGHRTGDEVLVVVADRIGSVVRPSDLVARIGGDEFAVLCHGLSDIGEATTIADRVIEAVALPIEVAGHSITVDASVGIVYAPADAIDGDALLDSADRALYQAKSEGRGRWSLADRPLAG